MIGLFDSGAGGEAALARLREKLPRADIAFFADREHAPYGTKTKKEIAALVTEDVRRLRAVGAGKILIACCTASCVWESLTPNAKTFTYPILAPTAGAALAATKTGRIGVLATAATIRSGAFSDRLTPYHVAVRSVAAQALVPLVEEGHTDPTDPEVRAALDRALDPFIGTGTDTLILGCTHFPALARAIARVLPGVALISSVDEGADYFLSRLSAKDRSGEGKTIRL